ncbi:MAG: hypothetical protein EA358_00640, partial [Flavobacteriales bacterium]
MLFFAILFSLPAFSQAPFTIGTGTGTNTATGYPTPYGNWYWGNRLQMIYRASELTAAGMSSGSITQVAFNVITLNSVPALNDMEIKMKNSTTNDLTTAWETGMTTVFTSTSYTPSLGWNQHILSTPFIWDGTSNIIVEICTQNTSFTGSGNAGVQWTESLPAGTSRTWRQDAAGNCTNTGTNNLGPTTRPNAQFTIITGPCTAPPAAGTATASATNVCVGNTVNLSLNGNSFGSGQTYQWQSSPNNSTWTNIPGATNLNESVTVNANTYYRCQVTCNSQTSSSTSVNVDAIGTPLSGVYTVNQFAAPSATNFTSFEDLAEALNCGG